MSAIKSRIDPRSAEFQANAEAMRVLVADLRAKPPRSHWAAVKALVRNI
jgi:hypothetical protein